MRHRAVLCTGLLALGMAALGAPAFAADAPSKAWKVPRTADGHPDLQGNWTNATLTTLERPTQYGTRRALTAEEARAIENAESEANTKANAPTDPKHGIKDLPVDCGRGFTGVNCGYNSFWIDPGTRVMTINGEQRTSMILTTEDGRVPPITPEGKQRQAQRMAAFRGGGGGGGGAADGPESRSLGERCIMSFGSSAGPPMIPLLYNNNYQIVQSKDTVVILVEMVHDARVVRLNGRPRPEGMRTWMGDSVGHWEGDTLVVETTNIRREQAYRGATDGLKVTERYTRVSPDQIVYGFRIEDPSTFTQAWGGEVAMNATAEKVYEYACHEGNYALPGILAGAREYERIAEEEAAKKNTAASAVKK